MPKFSETLAQAVISRIQNPFSPSKIISSFASISRGKYKPVIISFQDGFENGSVYQWYKALPSRDVASLEIRKDVGGLCPHRFVLVHMSDGVVHRFDRRPEQAGVENAPDHGMLDLLLNKAVTSEDSYIPNVPQDLLDEIDRVSICEIRLEFDKNKLDLLTVISTCYAISRDTHAKNYTFLTHNCFFFSWTILMVISRYYLPYKVPMRETLRVKLAAKIESLVPLIVNHGVELFLELVIETVILMRAELGDMAATKAIPDGVLRFLWRRLFTLRLNMGLRRRLTKQVRNQLNTRLDPVYRDIEAIGNAPEKLDSNLWIDESKGTVEETIRFGIAQIKWDAVLDAISTGFSTGDARLADDESKTSLGKSLLGKRFAQFTAVWKAALPAGLQAVQSARPVEGQGRDLEDAEVFDRSWTAAQHAVLSAVQKAVADTNAEVNNPQRERVWDKIFEMWDDCWEKARLIVEPKSLATVGKIVDTVVETGSEIVLQAMREHNEPESTISACILKVCLNANVIM